VEEVGLGAVLLRKSPHEVRMLAEPIRHRRAKVDVRRANG
jgi:hypothetical protein